MDVVKALTILKKYVDLIEETDPQYKAIKKLVDVLGDKALPIIVGNALISYRLSSTGEQYWNELADYFSKNPNSTLEEFLKQSKFNRALREQKLKRLKKAEELLKELSEDPLKFSDLDLLRSRLAEVFKSRGTEKTIVFAAKMAYYFYKAKGIEVKGDVPLPIDLRIATLTCTSGVLYDEPERIMEVLREEAMNKWSEIAKEAGIKTLHLDAILWVPMRGVREKLMKQGVEEAREKFKSNLESLGVKEAEEVSKLLIVKPCPSST
ncbi:hypothetical protein EYM_00860 [Ignicoccus islandicus DSM 13165]|uniref:N-glycosylase/DNA lyase n=1 Tax=Ignicoccus islandicus DSM 13165 TaxID=940295 RepID=A0A0U3F3M9_9CREN|nr:N-glycosylase/DNA lyase [Ignicoccus islandicus]ALU12149.1 hypothetical protein EYM_00860 [Ignicoccus islandicus DSM 13165]